MADGLPNGSAAGLRAFAATCDVVLCDVFGTLHESERVFPGTAEALPLFREIGGVVVLVSNSVHSGARLAESLTERGVPRSSYDAVITSADGTRSALHERVVAAVHHLGPATDRALFDGLDISLAPVDEANLVVCTGYPEEDFAAALFRAFERGLNLVCTSRHRDQDRPLAPSIRRAGRGALPRSGGHVVETGKPGAAIYASAVERAAGLSGRAPEPARVLGLGDSLALDVNGALNHGFRALWVGGAD